MTLLTDTIRNPERPEATPSISYPLNQLQPYEPTRNTNQPPKEDRHNA
jgi:hypothetical protein